MHRKRLQSFTLLTLRRRRVFVFVAEGDKHYSPARIAGSVAKRNSVAEGDKHTLRRLLLAFSERARYLNLTQRFSLGYNMRRFQRQKPRAA